MVGADNVWTFWEIAWLIELFDENQIQEKY